MEKFNHLLNQVNAIKRDYEAAIVEGAPSLSDETIKKYAMAFPEWKTAEEIPVETTESATEEDAPAVEERGTKTLKKVVEPMKVVAPIEPMHYIAGQAVRYDGVLYRILKDVTAKDAETPDATPGLYAPVTPITPVATEAVEEDEEIAVKKEA